MRSILFNSATALMMVVGLTSSAAQAEFSLDTDLKGDQAIETLAVRIDVGADGQDLEEPVALDLGLGFPLWLHPVGRESSEPVPFGAIPQQSTADARVPSGSSVTFTFGLDSEAGQDTLLTTSRLVAGVQVSDVARIGFASRGANNWELAGYEIKINGQTFAANDKVNLKGKEALSASF